MNTIFIQIASYRDPELLPTLRDCIQKAKHPENLRFGICWQHSKNDLWDTLDEFKDDKRFSILDIDNEKSKGVCWARNSVQSLYNNEKYTLQIDSHHRFIEDWDVVLIEMLEGLQSKGYKKPLLTSYVPSYDPNNDPGGRVLEPWWMTFDRFIPEGPIFFIPAVIENWKDLTEPIPSRFYSAHFCFTLGQFCKEVPHDPNYYFHGEEISIAVRAYTWGYDLFHPHKVILWHEYTRNNRVKHWDDDPSWVEKNASSHRRFRALFGMGECRCNHDLSNYDFGSERSLRDYEQYAGVRFYDRSVQRHTLENRYAPNPKIEDLLEYENSFLKVFKHCIDISYQQVPEKDYDFWCVAFENEKGETIYRQDADENEINSFFNSSDSYIKLWRTFNTEVEPKRWIVWPHSRSKEWCDRIIGEL